ncbi:MAG: SDR family NAD(P)-dependent oxidoreductase, partial [Caldilineaceae bacterium]|nr:SDR family NAD(P)-dependent oxidoreductase [Caldilineaceae bacterium]
MNRIALITGASRGLGKTLAGFLAAQGADLVITARGATDLRATARELEELGSAVIAIPGDITDEGHRLALAHAVESLGGLDLLINNASTLGATPLPALVDYPLDALATSLDVNVIGPLALVQAVLPSLIQRRGLVVNISSDAA